MRRMLLVTLFLFFVSLSAQAQAPAAATTPGPVWRVSLYKVKPGKMPEVMADLRQNFKVVNDEYKKQGLIVDYKVYTNSTTDSPGDWDIAVATAYKNWAALDDLGRMTDPITLKHYGTREKRQEAADKRNQLRDLVSSRLMRELTLNPMP